MADPGNSPETFTLVQWAVGAGAVIGSSVAAFFGVKSRLRRDTAELSPRGGVEWFFDGPIGKFLEIAQGIYRELKEQRKDADRHADENNRKLDEQTDLLRALKTLDEQKTLLREIKDRMAEVARRDRPQRRG